jgi:hypothetical protein
MLSNITILWKIYLNFTKMQVRVAEFNMHVFPPKFCSNYAILIFLREMMKTSHFYIIIKSKVGVEHILSPKMLPP